MGYQHIRFASLKEKERFSVYSSSQMSLCDLIKGQEARRWLYERGIDTETISAFRLGYVPSAMDHPFSGRMVIPIFDQHNELLALSVRPLTNDKAILSEFGKYWNERYDKGWHLFGLNRAKFPIAKQRFVIVVEGQFDVISMHAFGFTNTVGVLGGAFTPWQARLLTLWTKQIVLMFDGDSAGKEHTDKALKMLAQYGDFRLLSQKTGKKLKVAVAKMPSELDPNKFLVEHGSVSMRKLIGESMKSNGLTLPENWWKSC